MRSSIVLLIVLGVLLPESFASGQTLRFSGIKGSLNTYISMRVLTEAYAAIGIKVELVELPAQRALHASNSGKLDGEVFRIGNIHKHYTNLVQVPTIINELQGIAFVKGHSFSIDGWSSLAPYRVAGQVGVKFVEQATQEIQPHMVETNGQLFKMLERERVDVAVAAYVNGVKTIKELNLTSIQALQPPLQIYPLYHYLHSKHRKLVPRLNAVLARMQSTGRIQAIRRAYINEFLASDP